VKVENKTAASVPEQGEKPNSAEQLPAHLAFRQIVIHEISAETATQPLRLHFHYRGHSKHLSRGGA